MLRQLPLRASPRRVVRACQRLTVSASAQSVESALPRASDGRVALLGLPQQQLGDWLEELGEKRSRAKQTFASLYRHALPGTELTVVAPDIAASFTSRLQPLVDVRGDLTLTEVVGAADGTRKLLFALAGGGTVESVLIPAKSGARTTLCISSQLGCAQNCQFCATGMMGLRANLTQAQIIGQVLAAKRLLAADPDSAPPIANIVFMGMGEPLHNLDAVLAAVNVLTDEAGFALSRHHVTVSTSGLVQEIRRLALESRASVAVSLNATTDEVRSFIMPINRKYPLAVLLGALRELFGNVPTAPPHRRRDCVFFEYVLLKGVNDSDADAERLAAIAKSLPCKVNLIGYNAVPGIPFTPSDRARLLFFRDALASEGIVSTIRESRGDDRMAACGQLGNADEPALWKPQPPRMKVPAGLASNATAA